MAQAIKNFRPETDKRNIESYRRERSFYKSLTLIDLDKGKEVASVRFYGPSTTVYCVAWIWLESYTPNLSQARGYGKAGGGGYHKESAAMAYALEAAGIVLEQDISGRGDGEMQFALEALAAHLNIARPFVLSAHA